MAVYDEYIKSQQPQGQAPVQAEGEAEKPKEEKPEEKA